nr:thiamine diphosphokinase [uncultured Acetatifactor sp.]
MNSCVKDGKCIVIGAGDLTVGQILTQKEDYIIAVDGGLSYCGILELEPHLVIGDFDSLGEGGKRELQEMEERNPGRVVRLNPQKEDTDMLAALKQGLARGYRDFRIYAGMGDRLDHTLANIQCLLYLKNNNAEGYLLDAGGMILVLQNESVEFKKEMEGILSLFSLGREARGVSIRGMKYPLTDYTMKNDFPIGVSNEFIGESAVISVKEGELVCILQYA